MLLQRGQIEKVAHGVYRFPDLPVTEFDEYMRAVLWTGVDGACLSHDTALALYEVCDINPTRIHLTVPRRARVRRGGGEGYVLHREDLAPDVIGWLHQVRATMFEPTVRQCINSGVPAYVIRQALSAGTNRGLLAPTSHGELEALLEDRAT